MSAELFVASVIGLEIQNDQDSQASMHAANEGFCAWLAAPRAAKSMRASRWSRGVS
jgi:hypothetical protein